MTESEAIKNINALNAVCMNKEFYDVDFYLALKLAVGAIEKVQIIEAIGTVEEFKALKEKQIAKKPKKSGVTDSKGVFHATNGINGVPYDLCPSCEINLCTDGRFGRDKSKMKYCENCGQKLDWQALAEMQKG